MTRQPGARRPLRAPAALTLALLALLSTLACRSGAPPYPARPGAIERGVASWYGPGFHGRQTANGETYDMHALTAAHKTLPFGTIVEVRNLDNGRSVRVRINDRGPFVRGRVIDLSRSGAEAVGMLGPGTARVELRVLQAAPASTGYWVQAGAFRDRAKARRRLDELEPSFPEARLVTLDGWHRVRLGPYRGKARANETARRLRRRGIEAIVRGVA